MKHYGNRVEDVKIAYIGGGSRAWARRLMNDLVKAEDVCGEVRLYDIDKSSAEDNKIVGERYNQAEGVKSKWQYVVADTLEESLKGVDFVVISITPGTYDEMESDVHSPEKYGIYQPVGDSTGLGGIIRSLRTGPMFEEIGLAIKKCCPQAWVINYTNPMALCVKTLYRVFPEIKAFGCCHEVFGTQRFLVKLAEEIFGMKDVKREEVKVNVVGINHFTWLTSATCRGKDLFKAYPQFVEKYYKDGFLEEFEGEYFNSVWRHAERVKMDLFKRFGYIAAAGDRHLAEFCPPSWYLDDKACVEEWKYALTDVAYRKKTLKEAIELTAQYVSGERKATLFDSGEEGVEQIRALLGLRDLITNVNVPNYGQIPNLPIGTIVETNATFRTDELNPVFAGNIPTEIYSLVARVAGEVDALDKAIAERSLDKAFAVFTTDPQMRLPLDKAKELFDTMVQNTKAYLKEYH